MCAVSYLNHASISVLISDTLSLIYTIPLNVSTNTTQRTKDMGTTGEVITGTGDQLPAAAESKRMHFGANNPLAKGHDRYDKHARQKESDLERYAGEGAGVDVPPGEEGLSADEIRDSKGA